MKNPPLKDTERQQMNSHLRTLHELGEKIQAAMQAEIRGAEELQKRHQYLVDNITKIKEVYFRGKP